MTELGNVVLKYLQGNFTDIIHKDFTVQVEKDLDLISQGKLIWQDVVKKVYDSFIDIVKAQIKNKPSISSKSKNTFVGEIDDKELYVGSGRYGPFMLYDGKFTNITSYLSEESKELTDITIDDYPKIINNSRPKSSSNELLGKIKGKEVHKGQGKYGPFILYNKKFTSISNYLKKTNKTLDDIVLDDCNNILHL